MSFGQVDMCSKLYTVDKLNTVRSAWTACVQGRGPHTHTHTHTQTDRQTD